MADEKRRLVSLTVVGGPLDGQRCLPDDVVGELLVGSDPECQLVLDLPGISPIHARLWTELDGFTVRDTHAPRGVYVNDARVETDAPVGEGDLIWLGPPGNADSVCLKPEFGPWVEVLPFAASDDPFYVGEEPVPVPAAAPALTEPLPVKLAAPERGDPGEPMLLVEDDLAAIAGVVAAEDALAAPDVAEPEVTPQDDFFVADEPPPAEPAKAPAPAAAPRTAAVPAVKPPQVPLPVAAKAPAPPSAGTGPVAVATPAARPAAGAASPAAPVAPAQPHVVAAPTAAPPAEARRAAFPAHPGELGPDRTAPHVPAAKGATARRSPAAASSRRPASRGAGAGGAKGSPLRMLLVAAAVVGLAAVGFAGWRVWAGSVRLDAVTPERLRAGQHATLTGRGFAADAAGNVVLFDDLPAKVLAASPARLEVEVPVSSSDTGSERRASVVVRARGRTSAAVQVAVLQGPRLHGLSPQAAMPGEEVTLAGVGWGPGAAVRFGSAPAEIVELGATRIRVLVPAISGDPGTLAPVVVTVAGVESNTAPFVVGHPPVITGLVPATAGPGDTVQVTGVGFEASPLLDDVRVGGVPALVVSAAGEALAVVVPRLGLGEATRVLEVRVPGGASVASARLAVAAPAAGGLRFVAEPFTAVPGRSHAVVASGIGPVFVLAASGGRSAAQRALDAQQRLNAAVELLRTTLGLTFEARGFDARPVIALTGRPEALVEVTDEDAAAYNEDWTRLRGRGGAVTPGRLARWWEALARDLVLVELRNERPRYAAALAPEGRALVQLSELAQKSGKPATAPELLAQAKPPLREGLRLLALRVPAGVTAPAAAAVVAAAATPAPPRLQLEGTWRGSELEEGLRRYVTITFSQDRSGSISFEGGLTLTMPLVSVEPRGRDGVRFSVRIRGGMRYYSGKWDGEKLVGSIATDEDGREVVARFELRR